MGCSILQWCWSFYCFFPSIFWNIYSQTRCSVPLNIAIYLLGILQFLLREWVQTNLNFSLKMSCLFFSRLFTCRIASCMYWEDEFRCISMIFNVILVYSIVQPSGKPSNRRQNFWLSAGIKLANRVQGNRT
jgi:hypothetical protein